MVPLLAFLACHGSRDPGYEAAFRAFVVACRQRLDPLPVWAGQLELGERPLADQLVEAARSVSGCRVLALVPLFVGGGVHVEQDLPQAAQLAQPCLPGCRLVQTMPIGQTPEVGQILLQRIQRWPDEAWILFGHGSRASGFAEHVGGLAQALPASVLPAFWAQSPHLAEQVMALYRRGHRRLRIQPFLLFAGGLTDTLRQEARALEQRWAGLHIQVEPVLAPDPLLIEAVARLLARLESLITGKGS